MKRNILAICVLFTAPAMSQRTTWQVTLSSGDVISNVELQRLNGDSLVVSNALGSQSISVESITEIRLVRKTSFWKGAKTGALIGAATGVAVGVAFGASATPSSGTIGPELDATSLRITAAFLGAVVYGTALAVVGGTIGGVVGAVSGVDDVYDLSQMPLRGKLTTIQSLLKRDENK